MFEVRVRLREDVVNDFSTTRFRLNPAAAATTFSQPVPLAGAS